MNAWHIGDLHVLAIKLLSLFTGSKIANSIEL